MKVTSSFLFIISIIISSCSSINIKKSEEQLARIPYTSFLDNSDREYFLYLPKGYKESDKNWPILMFLHGNGERGNGKSELDFIQIHGPLYEAWVQKRDLPFIIIAPQLHMFDLDKPGMSYITNRTSASIPKRLKVGIPKRPNPSYTSEKLNSLKSDSIPESTINFINKYGWNTVQEDLISMIDNTLKNYKSDEKRVYLTGLSFGGYGTWHIASKYPNKFAAINPIVGYAFPDLIKSIADKKIPGFGEVFRNISLKTVGTSAIQSRACAVLANGKYVFALPGSSGGVTDAWDGILKHQLDINHKPCNFVELFPRLKEK